MMMHLLVFVLLSSSSAVRTLVPEDDLERGETHHPTFWVRASRGFNLPVTFPRFLAKFSALSNAEVAQSRCKMQR